LRLIEFAIVNYCDSIPQLRKALQDLGLLGEETLEVEVIEVLLEVFWLRRRIGSGRGG